MAVLSKSMVWPVSWKWNAIPSFFFDVFKIFFLCFFQAAPISVFAASLLYCARCLSYIFLRTILARDRIHCILPVLFLDRAAFLLKDVSQSLCFFVYDAKSELIILYSHLVLGWYGTYIDFEKSISAFVPLGLDSWYKIRHTVFSGYPFWINTINK